MAPTKGTLPRSLRIPPELWAAAVDKAKREGTTVTAVVVAALRAYVSAHPETPAEEPQP